MASDVYFTDLRTRNEKKNKVNKIKDLFDAAGFSDLVARNHLTAIKIHFGESGNDSYISPIFVRPVVDKIKNAGARAFLTDSNTLYAGSRSNAVDHLITAIEHGFAYAVVGAPLIIADGLRSKNFTEIEINRNHFKNVKISQDIESADSMIVLSHFKGHELAGFGGAIKNLAMGCAPAAGKCEQHSPRPVVVAKRCTGCGLCQNICPVGAIRMEGKKSRIDKSLCIGCGECVTMCPEKAISLDWRTEIVPFIEKMTEYAYGAAKNKAGRIGCINFLTHITPDCDCVPWSDAPIVPDIGILASKDPVALDNASYDLVNQQSGFRNSLLSCNYQPGEDKFKGVWNYVDGRHQIVYAEKIGLGSAQYNLITL